MESPDLGTVQKALALVEQAISGRSHATSAVPYFAPTDIGGLPPAAQEAELRNEEEIAYGNRVRAGVHMSLAAAAASLRVCEALMKDSSQVPYSERQQELQRCAEDAQASKDLADHAIAVLAGRVPPKSDAMTEIRKIKAAVYQRFGQLSGGKP
ncbi:hypothetical protein QTH89_08265 [Variovorax sp. J22G21]|uniref:hypothetical protein n=1 Tax=Variovorax fucosicus TaxID=3053517 RepID=UPI00257542CE|nr:MULTISPECIES: hypothetical protein [unclassified Variovorax]MDM0042586.1 hypothetical protein [Variovorax sp. J22R193]MDM0054337.1 hypothetical protein [Variovorax sp. J22G47]MDM0061191.1 hypothetical protein [Variovorax sp. J22G21]